MNKKILLLMLSLFLFTKTFADFLDVPGNYIKSVDIGKSKITKQ